MNMSNVSHHSPVANGTPGSSDNVLADLHISPAVLIAFAVVLLILLLLGLAGNVAAIVAIFRPDWIVSNSAIHQGRSGGRRCRDLTTTNAYIVNLGAADLLFLLFCAPFQGTVYLLNHWPYGWFICKIAHFCQFCTAYASVWILTAMSIDRYAAIAHPLKSVKWRRSRSVAKVSVLIWTAAASLSSPWLYLYVTTDVTRRSNGAMATTCYDLWPYHLYEYRKWLLLAVTLVGFLIPAVIIFTMALLIARTIQSAFAEPMLGDFFTKRASLILTPMASGGSETASINSANVSAAVASAAVAHHHGRRCSSPSSNLIRPPQPHQHQQLHGSNTNSSIMSMVLRRRRRVCWLVFALAFIFFLFQGPQYVSLLWINFDSSAPALIDRSHEAFFVLRLFAHMFTYVHSLLNPLLYGLASGRIRNFLMGNRSPQPKSHVERVMAALPKNAGVGLVARRRRTRRAIIQQQEQPKQQQVAVEQRKDTPFPEPCSSTTPEEVRKSPDDMNIDLVAATTAGVAEESRHSPRATKYAFVTLRIKTEEAFV